MRALTLTQPWAGLVASGIKLVENRPRRMIKQADFGELFAIHASREINIDVYATIKRIAPELFDGDDHQPWFNLSRITGAVIAVATIDRLVDDYDTLDAILGVQRRWYIGPIGYVLRDVRALASPIPRRGQLWFWTLPDYVASAVAAQVTT